MRVGDHDRVLGLGSVAVAAEAATEVAQVDVDVLLGDARDLGGAEARFLGALIADPDVHAVVGHQHRGVAGLHARSGQIRRRVGRLDDLRGAREAGVHLPLVDADLARLIDGGQ